MAPHSLQRPMTAALLLTALAGPIPLLAQTAGGGRQPAGQPEVKIRMLHGTDDPALAQELLRQQESRMQLVASIESLAKRLDEDTTLSLAERRRLQTALELQVRQLTATHPRVGLDVGTKIVLERHPSVGSVEVRRVLEEAQRRLSSAARTGYVGITLSPTDNHVRVEDRGALYVRYLAYPAIISVEPGSPAERAGLQRGDTVIAYNGMDVRRELPMHEVLMAGHKVAIRVRRAGETRDVGLTVAAAPQNVLVRREGFLIPVGAGERPATAATYRLRGTSPARAGEAGSEVVVLAPARGAQGGAGAATVRFEFARGIAGAQLQPITEGLAAALGVKHGLLVTMVAPTSPAATAGVRDGDIIVKANGKIVESIPALSRVMREQETARAVTLELLREKKVRKVRLTW